MTIILICNELWPWQISGCHPPLNNLVWLRPCLPQFKISRQHRVSENSGQMFLVTSRACQNKWATRKRRTRVQQSRTTLTICQSQTKRSTRQGRSRTVDGNDKKRDKMRIIHVIALTLQTPYVYIYLHLCIIYFISISIIYFVCITFS